MACAKFCSKSSGRRRRSQSLPVRRLWQPDRTGMVGRFVSAGARETRKLSPVSMLRMAGFTRVLQTAWKRSSCSSAGQLALGHRDGLKEDGLDVDVLDKARRWAQPCPKTRMRPIGQLQYTEPFTQLSFLVFWVTGTRNHGCLIDNRLYSTSQIGCMLLSTVLNPVPTGILRPNVVTDVVR